MRDHPIAKHPNWKDYDDGWLWKMHTNILSQVELRP